MNWLLERVMLVYADTSKGKTDFMRAIGRFHSPDSLGFVCINRAYSLAEEEFKNVKRLSGEQYFEHLRAVALILIVHMRITDADVIVAALLHDLVEDIDSWTYERVREEFGVRVATLVWYLTEPDLAEFGGNKTRVASLYHRRLFEVPDEYVAAVYIKLADRLHNMLTIWSRDPRKIKKNLIETEQFYLVLAEKYHFLIQELEAVIEHVRQGLTRQIEAIGTQ